MDFQLQKGYSSHPFRPNQIMMNNVMSFGISKAMDFMLFSMAKWVVIEFEFPVSCQDQGYYDGYLIQLGVLYHFQFKFDSIFNFQISSFQLKRVLCPGFFAGRRILRKEGYSVFVLGCVGEYLPTFLLILK